MTHHKYQQTIIPQQKTGQQHNTLTTLHMPFSVISYPVSKRIIYLFPFLLIKGRHLLRDTQKAVERQIELFWLWYCTWVILHFQHSCLIHTNTHQKTVSPSSLFPGETWVTKSDCTKLHGRWVRQYYKKVVCFFYYYLEILLEMDIWINIFARGVLLFLIYGCSQGLF